MQPVPMQSLPQTDKGYKTKLYWGIGLLIFGFVLTPLNHPVAENIGALSCCGSMIMLPLAFMARPKQQANNNTVFVQARTAVQTLQPTPQPVVINTPAQTHTAAPVQSADAMKSQFQQKKKLEHLKLAQQRELARDYQAAVREYEAAEEFAEAGRIRALMRSMGQSTTQTPVQVNIGQVGNSVVQDSVVMPTQQPAVSQQTSVSQQPAAQAPTSTCAHCGGNLTAGWQFCPACNNPVS